MESRIHTPLSPSSPEASFSLSDVDGEFSDVVIVLSSSSEDTSRNPRRLQSRTTSNHLLRAFYRTFLGPVGLVGRLCPQYKQVERLI
jgi:hypothetical protein